MGDLLTETADGVIVNVRAAPRSSRAGLDGMVGDALKVRIRSAPVDGKARFTVTPPVDAGSSFFMRVKVK